MTRKLIFLFVLVASAAHGQSYTSNFPLTENPIAQGGWKNGHTNGVVWGDVQTTPGLAFGTDVSGGPPYSDSVAALSGTWTSDQAACGVVFIDPTLDRTSSGKFYEIEIGLRNTIAANNITRYEFNYSTRNNGTQYAQVGYWIGPINSFSPNLNTLSGNPPVLNSGDTFCASAIGTSLKSWVIHNGVVTQVTAATDTHVTSGSPGPGFYNQGGILADNAKYGFSSFKAANIIAVTCNQFDVQAALNAVTAADTFVTIPAGNCPWTSNINYTTPGGNTSLTIQGQTTCTGTGDPAQSNLACTDNTIIQDNDTADNNQLLGLTSTLGFLRVTGITFEKGSGTTKNNALILLSAGNNLRLDHNHFNSNFGSSASDLVQVAGCTYGVADHNLWENTGQSGNSITAYNGRSCGGATFNNYVWNQPTGFGGANSLFIEQNVFNTGTSTNAAAQANDCLHGGKNVMRFNTMTNVAHWQTHPTGSSNQERGCRATEIYGNKFTFNLGASAQSVNTLFFYSSGPALAWGNTTVQEATLHSGYASFVAFNDCRSPSPGTRCGYGTTPPPNGWGACGGPSAWDGNTNATGYPCIDQPGRGQGDLLQGSFPTICNLTLNPACNIFTGQWPRNALEPAYFWLNGFTELCCGNSHGIVTLNGSIFTQNQDWYISSNPSSGINCTGFTGATGVGCGARNLRPSTCTMGVAWWATDQGNWNQSGNGTGQGVLDKCTSTNTWTNAFYTPFCYPDPLITGGTCGGTGTPAISFAPLSVAFGNVLVGSTSPSTPITLSNPGSALLNINSITITGTNPSDFAQTNNCSTGVGAGGSCTITTTCSPASAASFSASVTVSDNAAGSPHTVPLTCTGTTAAAGIGFSPTSVAFGGQTVGSSSAPVAVTVTNTGSGTLTISGVAISGGNATSFSQTNNCTTVAPAATCTIQVTFTPQVAGALSSSVSVTDNAPASPQSVPLTGTGNGVAGIGFNPTTLSFGNETVGGTTAALSTTVSNPGTAAVTISSITLTGTNAANYAISANTCPSSLAVAATCVVSVTFTPSATGSRTANLTFTDTAPASPQNVALTGTGTQAGAGFSPTSLAFGNQNVSTTSAPSTVTLTNTGSATLNISNISTTLADYVISSKTCTATLAASATCTVSVTFTPSAAGSRSANLSFTDDAPASPQTVPLTGTGIAATLVVSPSSLIFPGTTVGQTSASQQVTLSNTSIAGNISISSIAVSGGSAGDFLSSNNCPAVLGPGASCAATVTFKPTATGARTSSLVANDSAPTSPQTVSLSGTGTQSGAVVSPLTLTFGNQPVGTTSAAQVVTLTNNGTATLNISSFALAVTDTYFAISAHTCGTTLAVNASCTVSITFTPGTVGDFHCTLSFTDDGPGSPQQVTGTGTGTSISVSFNPAALTFPNTPVSTTSAPQTITMSNTGNGTVAITSIAVTGTNAANFVQTNNCGASLAGSASCTVTVTFTPSANGSRSAAVTFTDSAPGSPQTVALTGTGFTPAPAVTLSTASLSFGNQTMGTQSNPQVVVITNTGTASLTISTATLTGANTGDFGFSTTCGGALAVNASCSYSIHFTPTANGSRTATFNVNTNAASSPDTVSLSGNGVGSPKGAPAPQTFGE